MLRCWERRERPESEYVSIDSKIIVSSNLLIELVWLSQVDLLKNKLGFDEAFNYKEEPDLCAAIKRLVNISERLRQALFTDLGINISFSNQILPRRHRHIL